MKIAIKFYTLYVILPEEHKMDAKLEDYISYRQSDDTWRTPILLLESINCVNIERFASISADRNSLFFGRSICISGFSGDSVDYFGVDAKINDELRVK